MTQDDILICTMFIAAILTPLVKNKLGKWLIIVALAIWLYLAWRWYG